MAYSPGQSPGGGGFCACQQAEEHGLASAGTAAQGHKCMEPGQFHHGPGMSRHLAGASGRFKLAAAVRTAACMPDMAVLSSVDRAWPGKSTQDPRGPPSSITDYCDQSQPVFWAGWQRGVERLTPRPSGQQLGQKLPSSGRQRPVLPRLRCGQPRAQNRATHVMWHAHAGKASYSFSCLDMMVPLGQVIGCSSEQLVCCSCSAGPVRLADQGRSVPCASVPQPARVPVHCQQFACS